VESAVLHTVQLALADGAYRGALREALCRSCAWRVESVAGRIPRPDCVLVLDEAAFEHLRLPLSHPERIVLITRQDPQLLAQAWDAGLVSVLSEQDPMSTVLLAIMAAALRVVNLSKSEVSGGISPSTESIRCANSPTSHAIPAQSVANLNNLAQPRCGLLRALLSVSAREPSRMSRVQIEWGSNTPESGWRRLQQHECHHTGI
jgi:hypothetical protein